MKQAGNRKEEHFGRSAPEHLFAGRSARSATTGEYEDIDFIVVVQNESAPPVRTDDRSIHDDRDLLQLGADDGQEIVDGRSRADLLPFTVQNDRDRVHWIISE
jgi:hypothetical protein